MIIRQGMTGRAGAVSDQLGAHWDLYPTSAELTGAFPVPGPFDGVSLFRVVNRQPNFERNPLYWERRAGDQSLLQAARVGKWKGLKTAPNPEHYDLLTDPGESQSKAPDPAEIAEQMQDIFTATAD